MSLQYSYVEPLIPFLLECDCIRKYGLYTGKLSYSETISVDPDPMADWYTNKLRLENIDTRYSKAQKT
jgi:hypothetical protein